MARIRKEDGFDVLRFTPCSYLVLAVIPSPDSEEDFAPIDLRSADESRISETSLGLGTPETPPAPDSKPYILSPTPVAYPTESMKQASEVPERPYFTDRTDLVLSLDDLEDSVPAGGQIRYDVTAYNRGPETATGVHLYFALDPDIEVLSMVESGSGIECESIAGRVDCNIDEMEPNGIDSVHLEIVTSAPDFAKTVQLSAQIQSEQDEYYSVKQDALEESIVTDDIVPTAIPQATESPISRGQTWVLHNGFPNPTWDPAKATHTLSR